MTNWQAWRRTHGILLIAALAVGLVSSAQPSYAQTKLVSAAEIVNLLFVEAKERKQTLGKINRNWHPGYTVMLLEVLYFKRDPEAREEIVKVMARNTKQRHGYDTQAWYEWLWSEPAQPHPEYPTFKSLIYQNIDKRFGGYFSPDRAATIRMDEVRWGGVRQDGIPPLRSPKMIGAREASYLEDGNIVFGLEVNGDARAYPKRILAWHEMFVDDVGGIPVAGVYCTLCGTVILFETDHDGVKHQLGTSGFLYRSNKLMYDQATQTLWNTIWGRPVIGPLVDKGIELKRRAVVTTTWGEWRRRHPDTQVLSLDTGHERDYGEGVAYKEYFATDNLMFNVPKLDNRLDNKAEVLTVIGGRNASLAISAAFLSDNPIHHDQIADTELVVLTDRSGANRVYQTGGLRFASWDQDLQVTDGQGNVWTLSEDKLTAEDGRTLDRYAAQRAFWFGWFAAYPETRLVQ